MLRLLCQLGWVPISGQKKDKSSRKMERHFRKEGKTSSSQAKLSAPTADEIARLTAKPAIVSKDLEQPEQQQEAGVAGGVNGEGSQGDAAGANDGEELAASSDAETAFDQRPEVRSAAWLELVLRADLVTLQMPFSCAGFRIV